MTPTPNMTAEQLERCRDAFERWCKSQWPYTFERSPTAINLYHVWEVQNLWEAFQAAWQAAQPKWLPIESAPRDGTKILVLEDCDVFAAHFNDTGDDDSYWSVYCGQPAVYQPRPTHWMPLPAPPSEATHD